jgi:hypothetical protein
MLGPPSLSLRPSRILSVSHIYINQTYYNHLKIILFYGVSYAQECIVCARVLTMPSYYVLLCIYILIRVLVGNPEGKRPLGRPRRSWVDNIKMDLRETGFDSMDWIDLAQDRDQWRARVNAVMNLRVP